MTCLTRVAWRNRIGEVVGWQRVDSVVQEVVRGARFSVAHTTCTICGAANVYPTRSLSNAQAQGSKIQCTTCLRERHAVAQAEEAAAKAEAAIIAPCKRPGQVPWAARIGTRVGGIEVRVVFNDDGLQRAVVRCDCGAYEVRTTQALTTALAKASNCACATCVALRNLGKVTP